jgi:zinc D-Ala-D-Ala dipeptidase
MTDPFGPFALLRERPIPDLSSAKDRKHGYRDVPIDEGHSQFSEGLVKASDYGILGENHYASPRNPPYYRVIPGSSPELWLREDVAKRLTLINSRLKPCGISIWLFDGWRPNAVQRYFFLNWMPNFVRSRHPDWTEEQIHEEVGRYWSAPTESKSSPSPHITGGAVDLTLCWADSKTLLWMGSLFDDVTDIAHADFYEGRQRSELSLSDDEARQNRRLLHWLMRDAGFEPNPSEWWHFSYGDQMWAKLAGREAAVYGATSPP